MQSNIFINSDPVLGQRDFSTPKDLEVMERELAERMNRLQQLKVQAQQPQQSQTPVWDEIDSIMQGLSEKEFELVSNNDEWIESNNRILALIQATQLQMLRPIIEQSKEGKDALDNHLNISKRIRKSASKVVDEELNDFQEYKTKYSNMPYDEYLKMKRETKKGKK